MFITRASTSFMYDRLRHTRQKQKWERQPTGTRSIKNERPNARKWHNHINEFMIMKAMALHNTIRYRTQGNLIKTERKGT